VVSSGELICAKMAICNRPIYIFRDTLRMAHKAPPMIKQKAAKDYKVRILEYLAPECDVADYLRLFRGKDYTCVVSTYKRLVLCLLKICVRKCKYACITWRCDNHATCRRRRFRQWITVISYRQNNVFKSLSNRHQTLIHCSDCTRHKVIVARLTERKEPALIKLAE